MKTVYVASDGRQFDNEIECKNYEGSLTFQSTIKTWADGKYSEKRGQPTQALRHVMDFISDNPHLINKDQLRIAA